MVTICLQCGDEGFSNAFVYCVKCLNFAVHRYCLDEVPETLDEFVYWVCDHCEVESSGNLTTVKPNTDVSERKDPTSLKNLVEEQGKVIDSKGNKGEMGHQRLLYNNRKRKGACFLQEEAISRVETKCSDLSDFTKVPLNSPLSTESKEYPGMRAWVENNRFHIAKTNAALEWSKTSNGVDKIPFVETWNQSQMKGNYSVADSPKEGSKKRLHITQQAPVYLEPPSTSVELAKPLMEPVWRGGFFILNKNDDIFDGLAAHLSTKVGLKVYEEARLFPAILKLDMYPKADVWPKSFQKSQPSDDNIALYFFAVDNRSEKLFDRLVKDMMHRELALKATVENAELLVFTSNELPSDYWRFQGKYYLWGVFRKKQVLSSGIMKRADI